MVTRMKRANPNHPRIMAVVPTPDLTLPFPRSCVIVLAPTEAVCCHNTDTSTKMEAMKMSARATCDTALDGKGLTSLSSPRSSVSSCQPGKVANKMKHMKAKTMATILRGQSQPDNLYGVAERKEYSHQVRKDYVVFECTGDPDQIQGILIDTDLARQTASIVAAKEGAAVGIDADSEVAHSDFKVCLSDDVRNCGRDPGIDLRRIEDRGVAFVVE